eukprot:10414948-Lingulodinium_polyedra.AAC.1
MSASRGSARSRGTNAWLSRQTRRRGCRPKWEALRRPTARERSHRCDPRRSEPGWPSGPPP